MRDCDDAVHSGSIMVLPPSFRDVFLINASTLEQYIRISTFFNHLGKSSFTRGALMVGEEFLLDQLNRIICISCC